MSERVDDVADLDGDPPVVTVSDFHGYRRDGERALLAVGETDRFDPVVEMGDDDRLHWAGNDFVLVLNGDLVDRGPDSQGCVDLAFRLAREAPDGRVRYTLGNHEAAVLLQSQFPWDRYGWYCTEVGVDERRRFLDGVRDGVVTVAFDGHEHTHVHAGQPDGVDAAAVNGRLREAAGELHAALGTDDEAAVEARVFEVYDDVFGTGSGNGRGPGAGPLWLDFAHLPGDSPPQVVGHTKHREVTRNWRVVCENVIREQHGSPGGEAAAVETPAGDVYAAEVAVDGTVRLREV
jgi:hypothetical protein